MNPTDEVMKWLVGLASAIALSLAGWNFLTVVGHEARITAEETRSQANVSQFDRIENKLNTIEELLRRAR